MILGANHSYAEVAAAIESGSLLDAAIVINDGGDQLEAGLQVLGSIPGTVVQFCTLEEVMIGNSTSGYRVCVYIVSLLPDDTVEIAEKEKKARNPLPLKLTGAVTAEYNGGKTVTVEIPVQQKLKLTGGVKAEYDGSTEVTVEIPRPFHAGLSASKGNVIQITGCDTTGCVTSWNTASPVNGSLTALKYFDPIRDFNEPYDSIGLEAGKTYAISTNSGVVYRVARYVEDLGMVACLSDENESDMSMLTWYVGDTSSYRHSGWHFATNGDVYAIYPLEIPYEAIVNPPEIPKTAKPELLYKTTVENVQSVAVKIDWKGHTAICIVAGGTKNTQAMKIQQGDMYMAGDHVVFAYYTNFLSAHNASYPEGCVAHYITKISDHLYKIEYTTSDTSVDACSQRFQGNACESVKTGNVVAMETDTDAVDGLTITLSDEIPSMTLAVYGY